MILISSFNNCTMGTGTLKVNGVDVGYLKGDVNLTYEYDVAKLTTGIPLKTRGKICRLVSATLEAGMAEISADNLAIALGGLTVSTGQVKEGRTGKLIPFGKTFSLAQVPILFTHISPVTNKAKMAFFHLASVDGKMNLTMSEDNFVIQKVKFESIEDESASATDNPLGWFFEEE